MPTDPRPGGSSSFDEECLCLCPCRLPPHWDSLPDCCLPEQDRQPPSFWRRFCDQDIDEPGHGRLHRGRVKDSRWQLVLDDAGSVEGIYAFIYCTKWRFGQVSPMPYGLTLKDSATQLLIKYKSGALVTQFPIPNILGVELSSSHNSVVANKGTEFDCMK